MLYYFYRIVCKDLEIKDCYIGSTKNLERRIADHRFNCNSEKSKSYNLNVYQFIRNNGGWKNWNIILIDKLEYDDKINCLKKERELIELYTSNLNKNIPIITYHEYKKYYNNNKEKMKEYQKKYQKENKEKIKEYREENKEKIKENRKEYREENKEKIKENRKVKICCNVCNCSILKNNISIHNKSKKHIKHIKNINKE
jgi:hypothetical protein